MKHHRETAASSRADLRAVATLVDLLEQRAAAGEGGYYFLPDGKVIGGGLTYPALAQQARTIARRLQQRYPAGSRALLLYPPGLSFLPAFFGCLYAGVIAVPVPLPDAARLKSTLPRLQSVRNDAEPGVVLTNAATEETFQANRRELLPDLPWLVTDTLGPDTAEANPRDFATIVPANLAYLQYTSGSTATPRGVMLTHANVVENLRHLRAGCGYDDQSISVNWMPHFHDFGLVEGLLSPLYNDVPCYVLSPLTVLKRPVLWLQAIDRHRGTHSHGPNFAFEMCLNRIRPEQRSGLDLSSWRVAANGAEPVRYDTLRRFAEAFAPHGFRPETFSPAYGLAEATLLVTIERPDSPPDTCVLDADALEQHRVLVTGADAGPVLTRAVVNCGVPQGDLQVRIVDPETRRVCPADRVGEIWLADPCIAIGYWRKPEDTRRAFHGRLVDAPSEGPFLRTGDLGFVRNGALYVTGRLKDLIIIGGINHYPQDIEWTVQSQCPELRRDGCAAFSVEGHDSEQLVFVAEPERRQADWSPLIDRIRQVIAASHDIAPAAIVLVERGGISKTSSGKLQRNACRQAFLDGRLRSVAEWDARSVKPATPRPRPPLGEAQRWLCEVLAATLEVPSQDIDVHTPFAAYGIDSRKALALVGAIEERFVGLDLSPTVLWQFPTVDVLSRYLSGEVANAAAVETSASNRSDEPESIAIVGVACRFPGAPDVDAFWSLLEEGRSAITSGSRLPGVDAGFLTDVDLFDASLFGLSANEAQAMDPQQRLLLEVAWEALESAGLRPADTRQRRGGVFVGISAADYLLSQFSRAAAADSVNAHTGTGVAFSIAANRLSYQLNLSGPSMAIDTACSSSLVAVHQACQSLLKGECAFALAGGVNLILSPYIHLALQRAGMLSPSQRCRTFDSAADGYVRGEGCGIVVLKRLCDAQNDRDPIVSVIRGSAINQGGRSNGLTAPSPAAQQALIREALVRAGLTAKDIGYVEAHGTGTRLGDPIEMAALQAAYGDRRRPDERCWIGSVKTNVGHLEAAAGIAGLIKTVLAISRDQIPPHLNLENVNPLITLNGTAFAIATSRQPWPASPRRAAVSSFGFGGTNAHVIVEEAPLGAAKSPQREIERPAHLFTLSARSPSGLRQQAARFATVLRRRPEISLADLCYTVGVGRTQLPERLAVSAVSAEALAADLEGLTEGTRPPRLETGRSPAQTPEVVFLFTGQGSQYAGMSSQLYATTARFRDVLQECDALLRNEIDGSILDVMFGHRQDLLDQTAYTQPALFALEYALARTWQHWGVEPAAVIGHSLGELVAACTAGVLSLGDSLRLVAARGRLMQSLPRDGAMLAVNGSERRLRDAIAGCTQYVSVAAVNGPGNVVLSGQRDELDLVRARLVAEGLICRYLHVSHAFHSPLMDPVLEEFRRVAEGLAYATPRIPFISNLDGRPLASAPGADYWTRHMRETVRFADGIQRLAATYPVFLEIGPAPVLSHLGAQSVADPKVQWLPSLRPNVADWDVVLSTLARLFVAGVTPDFEAFDRGYQRNRLGGLPTYPFERQQFALPSSTSGVVAPEAPAPAGEPLDIRDWGYTVQWAPEPATPVAPSAAPWWVLADAQGVGVELQRLLAHDKQPCGLAPDLPADIGKTPLRVVCLWALDWPAAPISREQLEDLSGRVLELVQRLTEGGERGGELWLVTRSAVDAPGEDGSRSLDAVLQSMLWGLGRTVRAELPDFSVRLVDVDGDARQGARQLFEECCSADSGIGVSWRGEQRYIWRLEPTRLEPAPHADLRGTWLITGGLGRLGLLVTSSLVDRGVRHLLIVGRQGPLEDAEHALDRLRKRGASILVRSADVNDYQTLESALQTLPRDWPPLEGVIHAAGVLDDGILHRQTRARFAAVLAPKVLGAWNLHLLTAHLPLGHFVLFSSAASLFGNPGQSAYAAANAFLDGLAHHRRARGLPALSLNWSAWATGADNPALARELEQHGVVPIAPLDGIAALHRAMALDVPQLALIPQTGGHILDHARDERPVDSALVRRLEEMPLVHRRGALTRHILASLASILGRPSAELDGKRGFFEQGVDSLNMVELRNRLQRDLQRPIPITLPFNFSTAEAFSEQLLTGGASIDAVSQPNVSRAQPLHQADSIAVVSMACRMPGRANNPEALWRLLHDGVDAISEVPADRWDAHAYYHPDPDHPGTIVTRYGGFVDAVDQFDPAFFGISPNEVTHLDPQQRLLLEVCWEVLERAGIAPSRLAGSQTGVFVGISTNDYAQRLNRRADAIDAYVASGNALSLAANRLSYVFGFEAPSVAIDTACSSSLVAIHQACQSLRAGESDAAIAGGVNLLLDPTVSINHSRAHMLAPDGRCKAFSAAADGMSRSEGCGLVLLKRLSDALDDGDPILAVIRGSAVNQDGRTSGLTVPNGLAQQRVIRAALGKAGLEPADIEYVEAHGTGTPLGDPIEAGALSAVFHHAGKPLIVGSVKTNLGHLESAAGVAGVIKTVLALANEAIPAHLHCESLNPQIEWARSPLRIPRTTMPWRSDGKPRRAGVSSFGFGGTNAHLILEEAPALAERRVPALARYLLPVSAKTPSALRSLALRYVEYLATTEDHAADICYTASTGRDHFPHRLAVVGDNVAELSGALHAWLEGQPRANVVSGHAADATDSTVDRVTPAAGARPADWAKLAADYVHGRGPDWIAVYGGLALRRVRLPGHPFERQSYLVPPPEVSTGRTERYDVGWDVQPPPISSRPQAAGRWVIFTDDHGWGEMLAREIERRGGACSVVRQSERTDLTALRSLYGREPIGGILHLFSLNCPDADDLDAKDLLRTQQRSLGPLLQLAEHLIDVPEPPWLWLFTRAAQPVVEDDRLDGLAQTPMWGLGRTLPLELPVKTRLVDLPAGLPTVERVEQVCDLISSMPAENQWALRAGRFHVPRLRRLAQKKHERPVQIRSDGSYLITGGFGSLGREIGRWLVKHGARSLWLVGRRGAEATAARAYLQELHEQGVATRVAALDVACESELTVQIAEWDNAGPRLRGVVHAAGANAETPLAAADWPRFEAVLAGKVDGAWALHRATIGLPLDFFLTCSSIAGLWGGHLQAAYSAANTFLDGVAAYRQARGQPALSLSWGPLSGSAMLSDTAATALRSIGIHPTPIAGATAHLLPILEHGRPQVATVAVDWPRFVPLYTSRSSTGFFAELVNGHSPTPAVPPSLAIDSLTPSELREALMSEVSSVLRLPRQRLDPGVPLLRVGLDSLMALDLKNRLQQRLGIEIALVDLLSGVSLNDLASRLSGFGAPAGAVAVAPDGWVTGEI